MVIHQNYSLKHYNTFGIDAKAQYFIQIASCEELLAVFRHKKFQTTKKLILGGGSNVLFTKNWLGLIIHINIEGITIENETSDQIKIAVGAGVVWHQLVRWAVEKNLGGIENLSLIPGTVGAAPIQNIGAYGTEIKDVFHSLEAYEIKTGTIRTFFKEDCLFGYRNSIFKNELKNDYIITKVNLILQKKPILNTSYGNIQATLEEMKIAHPTLKDVSNAVMKIRISKLPDPLEFGNAGSFFKNPIVNIDTLKKLKKQDENIPYFDLNKDNLYKIPAGWLIEKCDWKGYRENNVGVYEKQALILINFGNANGQEIVHLSNKIKNSVFKTFNINLENEVNIY